MSQSNIIRFPACVADQNTRRSLQLVHTGSVVQFEAPVEVRSPGTTASIRDSAMMSASEVWTALSEDRLVMHYQPQYDMPTGKTIAAEALVRIIDIEGNLVYPDRFIEMVEDSDLVVLLGRSVIKQSCVDLATSRKAGVMLRRIAINVSAHQLNLDARLPEYVDLMLTRLGLNWDDLEFELTERQTLTHNSAGMVVLNELASRGANVVIDDFGIGYSTLTYLTELPISAFKIDRSLVSHLPDNEAMGKVVKNLLSLASDLDLKVVAEGIETREQNSWLECAGCHTAQGFGYAKPMPIGELITQLTNNAQAQIGWV